MIYVAVSAALFWWRRETDADDGLREHFGGVLRAGLRDARASHELHRILWRAALFFAFASAVWAFLPIVARQEVGGGPSFYSLMLGSVGAGAIAGALLLPRLRTRLGQDRLVLAASLVTAAATALLALTNMEMVAIVATFVLGIAWIAMLTTLNSTTQTILPNWIKGRGLAIYLTAFNSAMAAWAGASSHNESGSIRPCSSPVRDWPQRQGSPTGLPCPAARVTARYPCTGPSRR